MGLRARLWPGWLARRIWFEVFLALVGTVAIGVSATSAASSGAGASPALLVAGGLLQAALMVVYRRTLPLVPFAAAVVFSALSPVPNLAVPITAYSLGRYEARWRWKLAAAVMGVAAVARPLAATTLSGTLGGLAGAALGILLPGAVGVWLHTRAQLLRALTERADRAEAERELLAKDAVLIERTRIAREMHDAVGHRVSLMVLQAGAIEMASGDRIRVEELAGQVQNAGRQALDELRQMVGVLRGGEVDEAAPLGPQPELDDLPRLIGQSRGAGMDVDLQGVPVVGVDPIVGRAAYRIVQEALTNAGKHARGARVCVTVERSGHELVVRVVNGPGGAAGAGSGGFGLIGLAERVRTLGGRLTAEPQLDGGFLVEAVLPE